MYFVLIRIKMQIEINFSDTPNYKLCLFDLYNSKFVKIVAVYIYLLYIIYNK